MQNDSFKFIFVVPRSIAQEILSFSEESNNLRVTTRDPLLPKEYEQSGLDPDVIVAILGTVTALLGIIALMKGKGKHLIAKIGDNIFNAKNFSEETTHSAFKQWIENIPESKEEEVKIEFKGEDNENGI